VLHFRRHVDQSFGFPFLGMEWDLDIDDAIVFRSRGGE
jgi:hypothetical protein